MRPLNALESHVALIRALQHPEHGQRIFNSLSSRSEREGNGLKGRPSELAAGLDIAATIVVTDRMLSAVLDRMPDIRYGQPVEETDLLFRAGYVVFPRPISVPGWHVATDDTEEASAHFDGGFWVPSLIRTTDEPAPDEVVEAFGDKYRYGITYGQCVSRSLGLHLAKDFDTVDGAASVEDVAYAYRTYRVEHLPIYVAGWGYGLSWAPEDREPGYHLSEAGEFERRFWLSLWRTLAEETIAPVHFKRADYRRNARLRAHVPEVVVADLRRIKHRHREETTDDGAVIMWSHRWRVREHTRTLHRGTSRERTVLVREHVKGPEHLPILEKDRVWRLSR